MPWTSWPSATRRGTNCFPIAPVAPATNTRIVISLIGTTTTRQGGPRGCDTCPMLRYELLDRALSNHLLPDPVLLLGSRLGDRGRGCAASARGGVEAPGGAPARARVERMSHRPDRRGRPTPPTSSTTSCRRSSSGSSSARGASTRGVPVEPTASATSRSAEEAMLALTCERAEIEDGMSDPRPRLRLGLARRSGSPSSTRTRGSSASPTPTRAARAHRGRGGPARLHQPRDPHRRRQRLRPRPGTLRPGASRSRCSSTCATGSELLRRIATLAETRRQARSSTSSAIAALAVPLPRAPGRRSASSPPG